MPAKDNIYQCSVCKYWYKSEYLRDTCEIKPIPEATYQVGMIVIGPDLKEYVIEKLKLASTNFGTDGRHHIWSYQVSGKDKKKSWIPQSRLDQLEWERSHTIEYEMDINISEESIDKLSIKIIRRPLIPGKNAKAISYMTRVQMRVNDLVTYTSHLHRIIYWSNLENLVFRDINPFRTLEVSIARARILTRVKALITEKNAIEREAKRHSFFDV